jgi:hypothetical protein
MTGDDCRAAYNSQCWTADQDACGPLITQDLQSAVTAVPDTDLIPFVRPSMLVDINGPVPASDALLQSMPSDRAVDTTSVSLISLDTLQPVPPPLTYTGAWLGSLMGPSLASASFVSDPWEAGTEVDTCSQYVYKKFYDYERFAKRAAATCGTDGMCVYRMATNSPWAIEGAGVWRTLNQKSSKGLPIVPQVRSAVGLAYDMQAPAPASDQVAADEADARQALAAAVPEIVATLSNNPEFFVATPKNPFFAYDISFLKGTLDYVNGSSDYQARVDDLVKRVEAGRRYYAYADEWKYHADRLAAQGDLTLAEREDIESRVHAYRAAIARLKALIAARISVQGDLMNQADAIYQLMHNRVPGDPDPLAQIADSHWVNVPMSAALPAGGVTALIAAGPPGDPGSVVPQPGATPIVGDPSVLTTSPGVIGDLGSVAAGGLPSIAGGAPATTMMAWRSPAGLSYCDLDPLGDACLYSAMNDVYVLLGQELDHVSLTDPTLKDQGCLNPNDARCDWSAKDFADQWLHLYKRDLEATYSSCIDNAGSDDLSALPKDARVDVDALDAYFVQKAQDQAKVQAVLGGYELTPGQNGWDGQRKYGQTRTGGNSFGNPKSIAMDYDYQTGWYLTSSTNPADVQNGMPCRVEAEIKANFHAHATVLKTPFELIDTEHGITGHGGQPTLHSHLKVLTQDVYPEINADIPELGSGDRADPSLCASDVFVIFVVPVTVEMCIAAHYGYDVHFGSHRTPDSECDPNAFALHAGFKPWASTDVTGSIAVGVPDIEAGVRGDVEVLRMSLQVNGEFGVGLDGLNLQSDARIDMNQLSGKVELFADALLAHAEKTLFEWPGLHETLPLWNLSASVPLGGLVQ